MQNTTGIVFDIVHGSFVDGPGVRTTVFLKGCPLRCLWCCNPEGQKPEPELKFVAASCNECGKCLDVCPVGAIKHSDASEKLTIDRTLCTMCGKCVDVCPEHALGYFGKRMTVGEVMQNILKDASFFSRSGGGVTIGGGEATAQPDFALALVRACRENYIHTAVDTCGYTTSEKGLAVLEEADMLLFDVKGIDPVKHKNNTGVSNEIILNNLRRFNSMKKPIIIRIPFIPGYNDSRENVEATVALLEKMESIERVDIIGYHEYSKIKYRELGRPYPLAHIGKNPLTEETLEAVKAYFEEHGLHTQLGG